MTFWESIGQAFANALSLLSDKFVASLPSLVAALVILIIGIFIAKLLSRFIKRVLETIKIDPLVRKINIVQKIEDAGTKVVLSDIMAWLVKWFLYVVLLLVISEILNLNRLAQFINDIALYLPNVIIAALILVVGLVLGDFVDRLLVSLLKSTKAKLAPLVGAVSKWAIFIFSLLAALIQLGVAVALIQTLFTAIVVTLALATGLAFGLGGKEAAKEVIEKVKKDISE